MAQILETVMLICFGFSWPMSVIRNYKAGTARSMSLPFILMIIVGYVAGIAAKFISHTAGFVLIVYFINLVMVSANLVIYFRNLKLDRKKEKETETAVAVAETNELVKEKAA